MGLCCFIASFVVFLGARSGAASMIELQWSFENCLIASNNVVRCVATFFTTFRLSWVITGYTIFAIVAILSGNFFLRLDKRSASPLFQDMADLQVISPNGAVGLSRAYDQFPELTITHTSYHFGRSTTIPELFKFSTSSSIVRAYKYWLHVTNSHRLALAIHSQ
ncbi:hypothetical protein JOM56_004435 [Amanita muscaria]